MEVELIRRFYLLAIDFSFFSRRRRSSWYSGNKRMWKHRKRKKLMYGII